MTTSAPSSAPGCRSPGCRGTAGTSGARLAGIESALAAGVDSIDHCTYIAGEDLKSTPTDDLLARLTAAQVGVSISIGQLPTTLKPPAFLKANLGTLTDAASDLLARGARLCVGTDAGIAPMKPHDVLPRAHLQMVAAGVDAATSLRAITRTAADVVGLGASKGRVQPGYDADVLAVDGDPLADPTALLRVVGVWHRGRRVV